MVPRLVNGAAVVAFVAVCGLTSVFSSACVAPLASMTSPATVGAAPRLTLPEQLRVRTGGKIVSVDLESYVVDTILSEVSPLNEPENVVAGIFEVQAVIARTYAVARDGRHHAEGFDVCDTTHCQLYQPARRRTSRFAEAATQAVERTRSVVLTYDGRPIEALFHADCGGATAAAETVWGGAPVPYLQVLVDDLPDPTHRAWRVSATVEQLRKALNGDARTTVGRRLDEIAVGARDDSGRASGLNVRGEKIYAVRGDVLRSVLNRALAGRGIQSTLFTIQRQGAEYIFSGTGFGHGVGLCQRGAASRLRRGDSVNDVLRSYYVGTRLARASNP